MSDDAKEFARPLPDDDDDLRSGDAAPNLSGVSSTHSPDEASESERPRRRTAASKRGAPVRRPPTLQKQLEDAFGTLAIFVMSTGDDYCANVLAAQGPRMAEAWADLAKVNTSVDRILRRAMEGSAWGAVVMTTAATVIPIAAHHGLFPREWPMPFSLGFGPPPPPSDEVKGEGEQRGGESPPSAGS